MSTPTTLHAGAAETDITPTRPCFLHGYPHVPRQSTGTHDPLLASALYLSDGDTAVLFIACDVLFIPKALADRARERIQRGTGVPADHVLISATHTHSGPVTTRMLSHSADPIVPEPDPEYMRRIEGAIVATAKQSRDGARPAKVGLAIADGAPLGSNRHDPAGPRDPDVPVLAVRSAGDDGYIGLMIVCSMHPTVLHEDSTVFSGDFPGLARRRLQQHALGCDCPVIYHMGAAGNQSPRHVTRSNTLAEAQRLGEMLGDAIAGVLPTITFQDHAEIRCAHASVQLPLRSFPLASEADADRVRSLERFKRLRESGAPRAEVRSAECDWFGAEETLTLARAAESGELARAASACMPARVQLIRIGPWSFVGWPGEAFVEFAREVRDRVPDCYIITLANGDLEGYIVTERAVQAKTYEAGNAVFQSPDSGRLLVDTTMKLIGQRHDL